LRTKDDEEGKHALLKADGKYELDTLAKGVEGKELKDATEFQARNEQLDFRLNPADQNNKTGHGTVSFAEKVRIWARGFWNDL
jgi:hypothetical protein